MLVHLHSNATLTVAPLQIIPDAPVALLGDVVVSSEGGRGPQRSKGGGRGAAMASTYYSLAMVNSMLRVLTFDSLTRGSAIGGGARA